MTGRVRFVVGTLKDVVLIPEGVLLTAQGSKAVYVVDAGSKAALRPVTVEGSYRGSSIVTHGLAGGERVIIPGSERLRTGQAVAARGDP